MLWDRTRHEEKVRAIKDAPAPKTLQELRSFLGMLNFYGIFIPNLSTILAPLNVLLRKNTEFTWNTPQQKAFNMAKQCLISAPVVVHYDSEKDIVVSCDASLYGLGAVIAHKFDDGTEETNRIRVKNFHVRRDHAGTLSLI